MASSQFRSHGYEYLYAVRRNVLAKVKSLRLVFQQEDEPATPFDVARWLHVAGATNIEELAVIFEYDACDFTGDVDYILQFLLEEPRQSFNIDEIFSRGNIPRLRRGEVGLRIPLLGCSEYEEERLSILRDNIQACADTIFANESGGVVDIKGLLIEEEENSMYIN